MAKRGLGRGLDALMQGQSAADEALSGSVQQVPLADVTGNPEQPRKNFDDASLQELAESIREKGVIQPMLVEAQADGRYQIVAGERRHRAAEIAGLETVPVIVREFTSGEKLEIALIENIQREDLSPIEEATAYKSLMESSGLSQGELAKRLGKNRSTVANAVRLLRLPSPVQQALDSGELSAGHARALLQAGDEQAMEELFRRIRDEGLSVRFAELLARGEPLPAADRGDVTEAESVEREHGENDGRQGGSRGRRAAEPRKSAELQQLEEQLIERLGTKVVINGSDEKGRVEISYYSLEDLNRLTELFLPNES